ncbi:MAG TPA: hypothetical protein VFJ51_13425, partial [Nitrososphaeraceae archaeon]|nr:hypothetical protein [Nitrososphaeraceae archaeon]
KPIDKSNGELRYCITDPILSDFIMDCWSIIDLILHRMRVVWNNLRKPSEAEDRWYAMLY